MQRRIASPHPSHFIFFSVLLHVGIFLIWVLLPKEKIEKPFLLQAKIYFEEPAPTQKPIPTPKVTATKSKSQTTVKRNSQTTIGKSSKTTKITNSKKIQIKPGLKYPTKKKNLLLPLVKTNKTNKTNNSSSAKQPVQKTKTPVAEDISTQLKKFKGVTPISDSSSPSNSSPAFKKTKKKPFSQPALEPVQKPKLSTLPKAVVPKNTFPSSQPPKNSEASPFAWKPKSSKPNPYVDARKLIQTPEIVSITPKKTTEPQASLPNSQKPTLVVDQEKNPLLKRDDLARLTKKKKFTPKASGTPKKFVPPSFSTPTTEPVVVAPTSNPLFELKTKPLARIPTSSPVVKPKPTFSFPTTPKKVEKKKVTAPSKPTLEAVVVNSNNSPQVPPDGISVEPTQEAPTTATKNPLARLLKEKRQEQSMAQYKFAVLSLIKKNYKFPQAFIQNKEKKVNAEIQITLGPFGEIKKITVLQNSGILALDAAARNAIQAAAPFPVFPDSFPKGKKFYQTTIRFDPDNVQL